MQRLRRGPVVTVPGGPGPLPTAGQTAILSPQVCARGAHDIPSRCGGNAYDCAIAVGTGARGRTFEAADFRLAVMDSTADSPPLEGIGFLSFSSSYDKVQYAPAFGMELVSTTLQGANGSGTAGFPGTSLISSTKFQASADEFILITGGLSAPQAEGLAVALREAGVSTVKKHGFAALRESEARPLQRTPREAANVEDISASLFSTS